MRSFVEFMRGVGVLTYEFQGAERLGRPGQMVLANHPSLIDVVFLIAFTPQADLHCQKRAVAEPLHPLAGGRRGIRQQHLHLRDGRADGRRRFGEGQSVIIFPEGTRTTPGQAMQFHRGAANIAVKAAAGRDAGLYPLRADDAGQEHAVVSHSATPGAVHASGWARTSTCSRSASAPPPIASRAFNEHLLRCSRRS